jgi:hypothetical protein
MAGMGGDGLAPLNASGVDFSNETQAMDFLGAMLDDSVLQIYGNAYARDFWYGVVVFLGVAGISNVMWRLTLKMRYFLQVARIQLAMLTWATESERQQQTIRDQLHQRICLQNAPRQLWRSSANQPIRNGLL